MITTTPVNIGIRIASMVLDHFIMTFLATIFFLPQMVIMMSKIMVENPELEISDFFGPALYVAVVGYALYLCKDSLNGRSFAKRIVKLQVVDNTSGEPASPFQCLVRNLFCIIWPMEVVVTLANPDRRIGDHVAGTRVVIFDPAIAQPKPNVVKILIALAVAYALLALPVYAILTNIG